MYRTDFEIQSSVIKVFDGPFSEVPGNLVTGDGNTARGIWISFQDAD